MKNKLSVFALLIVGLVTVIGCGRLAERITDNKPVSSREDRPGTFTLAGKEWKSFDIEQTDIKVDLPGEPTDKTPSSAQLPPGTKDVFSAMKIHAYDEKDFASSYTQLEPTGKRKFQIKELADTSMASLKRQAPDLKYTLDIRSETNAKFEGTMTRNGKAFELKGCCIYQKTSPLRVWAVITVYTKDSADGRTASERIIDSAYFKGSTEVCK